MRRLVASPGVEGLDGVARSLERSEAIASSQVEGVAPSPQQVALAELAQEEPLGGVADQARLVANDITVLRVAASDLVTSDAVTAEDVEALHRASSVVARGGLEELAEADVLRRKRVDRGTTAHLAGEVFDLLGHTEGRLASTQWDTRLSPPVRPVPARPA